MIQHQIIHASFCLNPLSKKFLKLPVYRLHFNGYQGDKILLLNKFILFNKIKFIIFESQIIN